MLTTTASKRAETSPVAMINLPQAKVLKKSLLAIADPIRDNAA